MTTGHIEFLVEEPSMEAFLREIVPRIIGDAVTFTIHTYQGKRDLLTKVESRLRAYAKWLPDHIRIVVVIDRDDDDCVSLKQALEDAAAIAGLTTRKASRSRPNGSPTGWRVVTRIAIEELEAWFFGQWSAVRRAYPRVSATAVNKAAYRDCDRIAGGTWEALERVMKQGGYFSGGLRKVEAAQRIGEHFDPSACLSPSFQIFRTALLDAVE